MAHSSDRTLLASLGFADPDKRNPTHTLACQYVARPEVAQAILGRILFASVVGPVPILSDDGADDLAEVPPVSERPLNGKYGERRTSSWRGEFAAKAAPGECEVGITRSGNYLVGFWDVVVPFTITVLDVIVSDAWTETAASTSRRREAHSAQDAYFRLAAASASRGPIPTTPEPVYEWVRARSTRTHAAPWRLYVEVKAMRTDVADIARQLELYQANTVGFKPGRYGEPRNAEALVVTTWPLSAEDKGTLSRKGIHHVRLGAPFEAWRAEQAKVAAPEDVGL